VLDVLVSLFGPSTVMFQCRAAEAEMVKYAENTYFATKVIFVNEIARLCATIGIDWQHRPRGLAARSAGRARPYAVFADAPGVSAGAVCQGLDALIAFAQNELGTTADSLEAVRERNAAFIAGG